MDPLKLNLKSESEDTVDTVDIVDTEDTMYTMDAVDTVDAVDAEDTEDAYIWISMWISTVVYRYVTVQWMQWMPRGCYLDTYEVDTVSIRVWKVVSGCSGLQSVSQVDAVVILSLF